MRYSLYLLAAVLMLFTFWGCSNTDGLVDPSSNSAIDNPGKTDGETDYVSPYRRYRICGTVFDDANQNGVQDIGEDGLPNVTVNLSGNGSTTTDANGDYCFWAYPGTYDVDAETFDPYNWSTTDNPLEVVLGYAHVYDADIGLTQQDPNPAPPDTYSICGNVSKWVWDRDQRRFVLAPVGNRLVVLYDDNWNYLGHTYTDANGDYCFTDVEDGDYKVAVNLQHEHVTVNGGDELGVDFVVLL